MVSQMDSPTCRLLLILLSLLNASHAVTGCYTSIFSFGDSLADTGNLLVSHGHGDVRAGRPPYGETYFHRPTGRFCDGRLVVDFFAQAMGLPLLPPYLAGPAGGGNFRRGVNFAVAGATALENACFEERGIRVAWTNNSLGEQIESFRQLLPSLCFSDSECSDMLRSSLFLVGEIGGNDYNYPFMQGRKLEEMQSIVPIVIDAISSAVNALIELGAQTLAVPGNLPIGCNAAYLTTFQSARIDDYNPKTGCINWLNEFARYHNEQLQEELGRIRQRHSHATIIYADYYEAAMGMVQTPRRFGFRQAHLEACCGGGGPYNYNASSQCGDKGSSVCADPSRYITWDGMHLTEAAYRVIATGLLEGPHADPPIMKACPSISLNDAKSQFKLTDALDA